jgi:quercetin dioxygenase-like cupin family protein
LKQSITAYEDLQFAPLGEGNPVEVALLWGDPATGPAAVLVRFPAGYAEPWHHHSSTYRSVLIKGEFRTRSRDNGETITDVYGPGAYLVQPGGAVHAEVNAREGEIDALVYFEGPVDFVLAA